MVNKGMDRIHRFTLREVLPHIGKVEHKFWIPEENRLVRVRHLSNFRMNLIARTQQCAACWIMGDHFWLESSGYFPIHFNLYGPNMHGHPTLMTMDHNFFANDVIAQRRTRWLSIQTYWKWDSNQMEKIFCFRTWKNWQLQISWRFWRKYMPTALNQLSNRTYHVIHNTLSPPRSHFDFYVCSCFWAIKRTSLDWWKTIFAHIKGVIWAIFQNQKSTVNQLWFVRVMV